MQRARRPGPAGATLALEVPAAISAGVAKGIAEAALLRAEGARVTRTVPTRLDALTLVPGDVVTITEEAGAWRVEAVALEGMATTLTLTPLPAVASAATASAGRVLAQPDLPIGATVLVAAELPGLDDALLSQPRLVVVATGAGAGWRAAPLLLSVDGGASWTDAGATAAAGVMGTVETPLPAGDAAVVDRARTLTVMLARDDMMLGDADAAGLDRGANLALVGDELIQFARAAPLGGGRWALSELWRGRRGTRAAAGAVGDSFALLTAESVRTIDLPLASLGGTARLMAAGVGDRTSPDVVTVPVTGASILPPAPVRLRWTAMPDGGARVNWVRRSRVGWRWLDRVDAPLGEEREQYRVLIGTRELLIETQAATVTAVERAGGPVAVTVRQRGNFGDSEAATIMVEGI